MHIITTEGGKNYGDLIVGDSVFHPNGHNINVTALSAEELINDWIVTFSDGTEIYCTEDTKWNVYDRAYGKWRILETGGLAKRKLTNGPIGKRGGRYTLQIENSSALDFPDANLPIDPYFLGVWLGDGNSRSAAIYFHPQDPEPVDEILRRGFKITSKAVHKDTGVIRVFFGRQSIIENLKKLGCSPHKYIPGSYQIASIKQRLNILAGLIDTDGHVDEKGRVRIATGDKLLADSITKLTTTLGFRPYIMEQQPVMSTSGIQGRKIVYYVGFQPDMKVPVKIPRKMNKRLITQRRRGITSVRKESNWKKRYCIKVSSPDGQYLAGETLTPLIDPDFL